MERNKAAPAAPRVGARRPPTDRTPLIRQSHPARSPVLHAGVFLGDPLSCSRPPRLGRPCGPSRAIGCADPRPGTHSPGFGAYRGRRRWSRKGPGGEQRLAVALRPRKVSGVRAGHKAGPRSDQPISWLPRCDGTPIVPNPSPQRNHGSLGPIRRRPPTAARTPQRLSW
jgi:hypothetical protein